MSEEIIMIANPMHRLWSALGEDLVIDFAIDRDVTFGGPSQASIITKGGRYAKAPEALETIWITSSEWTEVSFVFDTGITLTGRFIQKNNVLINDENSVGIFVDIQFGYVGQEVHFFEGVIVYCAAIDFPGPPTPTPTPTPTPSPTPTPPIGPGDDGPVDRPKPLPVIAAPQEQLFPYVYLRTWSELDAEQYKHAFIRYPEKGTLPPFIQALEKDDPSQQKSDALDFVTGSSPPSAGAFLPFPRQVDGPVALFPKIADALHRLDLPPQDWLLAAEEILIADLVAEFFTHHTPLGYFSSAEYRALIERVWQSYFALVGLNDFSTADLELIEQAL